MLTKHIHKKKETFNRKVRQARDEKISLRDAILELTNKMPKMQKLIPSENHRSPPAIPEIYPCEMPDDKFTLKLATSGGGASESSPPARTLSANQLAATVGATSQTSFIDRSRSAIRESSFSEKEKSPFELAEEKREKVLALYKRDEALKSINRRIENFDKDVNTLRIYKVRLKKFREFSRSIKELVYPHFGGF